MRRLALLLFIVGGCVAVLIGVGGAVDGAKSDVPLYIKFQAEDFDGAAGEQPQWQPGWLTVSAGADVQGGELGLIKLRIASKPIKSEDWLAEQPQKWAYPNEWLPQYTEPMKINWQNDGAGYSTSVTQLGEIRCFFLQTHQ